MISVIMPIYNTEQYIDDAVNSIVSQTCPDWELIAIDDGSTDDSGRIIDEWASRDSRIRVFHTENAGVAAARNLGLEKMSGEYIQFIDSDDRLAPTTLEETVSLMEGSDVDMVIFNNYCEVMPGEKYIETSSLPAGIYDPEPVLEMLSRPQMQSYVWNKSCRSSLYSGITFAEGEEYEDVGIIFIPVSRARKIVILDKPLYYYRQREGSITRTIIADQTVHKWRYLQYRKRYEFLKINYPDIARIAKTSVLNNAVLYYAFFNKSVPDEERRDLYRFICSSDFRNGITSSHLAIARSAFRFFPNTAAYMIRKRIERKAASDR